MAVECVETQEWIEEEISKPVEAGSIGGRCQIAVHQR
jgi:hypothetical protein